MPSSICLAPRLGLVERLTFLCLLLVLGDLALKARAGLRHSAQCQQASIARIAVGGQRSRWAPEAEHARLCSAEADERYQAEQEHEADRHTERVVAAR